MDKKRAVIFGGGTVAHVRTHFGLGAFAYGGTARKLAALVMELIPDMDVDLHLTRMAGGPSGLETNDDVSNLLDVIIKDNLTKIVFFNVAMCDFVPRRLYKFPDQDDSSPVGQKPIEISQFGKDVARLSSSQDYFIVVSAARKVVREIRQKRKDIFLVAFKATNFATEDEQYRSGLNLLKEASCNLVVANDVGNKRGMIITPEEARYHVTYNRDELLRNAVDMAKLRSHLTFTQSTVIDGSPEPWEGSLVPDSLRRVVEYCIQRGAYKPFRGATVGHFACKLSDTDFLTSIRKSNFNNISSLGLVRIRTDGPDTVLAYGAKPSVGGQSQRIVFHDHPGTDCIVHFHCPIKEGSQVPQVSQREYECGSHECGKNTSTGLKWFGLGTGPDQKEYGVWAVFLKEHGPNVVFDKSVPAEAIIEFIERNFDLDGKTGGSVST